MKWVLVFLFFFSGSIAAYSQDALTRSLNFTAISGKNILEPKDEKLMLVLNADTIIIDKLKFYISHPDFTINSLQTDQSAQTYHLIDLCSESKFKIPVHFQKKPSLVRVHFSLGIDSLTNVSGVMGGDLDPLHGMYWTWQSGYINLIIEGHSRLCSSPKNRFQFHLGGYAHPYPTQQNITLPFSASANPVLGFDLSKFFTAIDLRREYKLMSPGKRAAELSVIAAGCFQILNR